MNRLLGLILLMFCVISSSGCVGTMVNDGMNSLIGEPIETTFQVLGYPDSKMDLNGDTLYRWSYNSSGVYFAPTTTSTFGYVGTTPVYGTTTGSMAVPTSYSGALQVRADKRGIIRDWSGGGQNGAMMHVASSLGKYAKQKKSLTEAATPKP